MRTFDLTQPEEPVMNSLEEAIKRHFRNQVIIDDLEIGMRVAVEDWQISRGKI